MGKAEQMMEQQAKKLFKQGKSIDEIIKLTGVSGYWLRLKIPEWTRRRF